MPLTTFSQDLPQLCATTANKSGGENPIPIQARFSAGISANGGIHRALARVLLTDDVEVVSTLKPDPAHVGQQADIIVTAGFAPVGIDEPSLHFMLGPNLNILEWDGTPENAVAFQTVTLKPEQTITLYTGHFILSSNLWVNIHYRLADGTVISSADPIEITILDAEEASPVKASSEDKAWTVMVYMVGSNLESNGEFATKDIEEMLKSTDNHSIDTPNIVVATGGSTAKGWETVKYYRIKDGRGKKTPLQNLTATESQMANPQTLIRFVKWAHENFPAQHYALILWNHGAGTEGFGVDTANGRMIMDLQGLYQAFTTIHDEVGKLDIVVYDACLMATIEIAEVTSVVANTMAASAEVEPWHGLDYKNLLRQVGEVSPVDGIGFGESVVSSYIQHAKDERTFTNDQITYSVFDLSQMEKFRGLFLNFATEFKKILIDSPFLSYETLSRGIIRAPAYPMKDGSKWIQRRVKGKLDHPKVTIRIDLINILETVLPAFPDLYDYANQLLSLLNNEFIVNYAGNINETHSAVNNTAGRVSLNLGGSAVTYLNFFKEEMGLEAYAILHEGLNYYNARVRTDGLHLTGSMGCYKGFACFSAMWLELAAKDTLSVDGYFGQQNGDIKEIYLIKSLYRYDESLAEDKQIGVDGQEACQYQICVEEKCENATLVEQKADVLVADVLLNGEPAVLSFCRSEGEVWYACGVLEQNLCSDATECEVESKLWGRARPLFEGDEITPSVLRIQGEKREPQVGQTLTVAACSPVKLAKHCDLSTAIIYSAFHGNNNEQSIELLCDGQDCVCNAEDMENNAGCQEIGKKAGIIIQY
jgi:hypothetical protein